MSNYGRRIPDWRDKDGYPKRFDDIYDKDWRWEFLRRNPKYQQAWDRGIPDTDSTYDGNVDDVMRIPAAEDSDICRTVFRLKRLVDPWGEQKIGNAPGMMFNVATGALTINPRDKDDPLGDNIVTVNFNLNLPLNPQLEHAKRHLKFQQKEKKEELVTFKKQKDKWPRHIRVIDAFDQGATPTEVYNQFAEEDADGNEDKLDEFYRPGSQPDATAMGWHTSALKVMEMAIRLL